jgi:hypothetical protein
VTIKDSKADVSKGTASSPNMTLSMSAQDYVDMIMGKLNGQMAFMSGKLKISGRHGARDEDAEPVQAARRLIGDTHGAGGCAAHSRSPASRTLRRGGGR